MKFFVSWTKREPLFQKYDPFCNILVSPANVPNDWTIREWEVLPEELFIDSGAFSFRNNNIPSCQEILKRQLLIGQAWPKDKKLYFSHPDLLIPRKTTYKDQNSIIRRSIERGKEYIDRLYKFSSKAIPVGVIHGFDEESIVASYQVLKSFGYKNFALGSIGIRLSNHKSLCLSAIDIVEKYRIEPVHLFGITLPLGILNLSKTIFSFDSSTPTKLAFYGTVLYGTPLKRYVISPTAEQKFHMKCFTFRSSIPNPLPCECPVCKVDPKKLLEKYDSAAKFNRIVHNYFQIKWETEKQNSVGHGH